MRSFVPMMLYGFAQIEQQLKSWIMMVPAKRFFEQEKYVSQNKAHEIEVEIPICFIRRKPDHCTKIYFI
jgi:hypothetical protein